MLTLFTGVDQMLWQMIVECNGLAAWGGVLTMEGQIIPAGGDQQPATDRYQDTNTAPGYTKHCPWRYHPCPGLQTLRGRAGTD